MQLLYGAIRNIYVIYKYYLRIINIARKIFLLTLRHPDTHIYNHSHNIIIYVYRFINFSQLQYYKFVLLDHGHITWTKGKKVLIEKNKT